MKGFGGFLILVGLVVLFGYSVMGTSVATETGAFINLSLMDSRRNGMMVGMGTILGGILLFGFGSLQGSRPASGSEGQRPSPLDVTRNDQSLWDDLPTYRTHGGVVKSKGTMKSGQWSGPYVQYTPSGSVEKRGVYEDGKPNGPYSWYSHDGSLVESGFYEDGRKCGEWFDRGRTIKHPPCKSFPPSHSDDGVESGADVMTTLSPPEPDQADVLEDLKKLGELRESGVLTEEEFEKKSRRCWIGSDVSPVLLYALVPRRAR